ncbi:hypothetical protein PENTCL1PPCAC_18868, partial [Pristionchus entomophagus]
RLTALTVHKCPRCWKPYQKTKACNRVICPCGQASCYVCGQAIESEGYEHFWGKKRRCKLFHDVKKRDELAVAQELQRQIGK